MPLRQRHIDDDYPPASSSAPQPSKEYDKTDEKGAMLMSSRAVRVLFGFAAVIFAAAILFPQPQGVFVGTTPDLEDGHGSALQRELSPEATLFLDLLHPKEDGGADKISLGPHTAKVQVKSSCKTPRFWIRLVGDALLAVHLQEDASTNTWTGSFSLPVAGSYTVDVRWYGCQETETEEWRSLSDPVQLHAVDQDAPTDTVGQSHNNEESIFPPAAWMPKKSIKNENGKQLSNYVWTDPTRSATLLETKEAVVSREGAAKPTEGYYQFRDLSNYELLCFVGNHNMENIRGKFLELRPQIASGQRPFKFHFYPMSNFEHPTKDWTVENKQRLRKCKHMLVALDDFAEDTPASQTEYKQKLVTFVGHLLNVMNDDTFPIRLFTWNQPPMQSRNTCSENRFLPRSTDHPCNDVIKDLFANALFPERVKLLDNTDLSMPQFDENHEVVLATIALRIFVVCGKQVADWRAAGQHGAIDGLHRNGKVEPNFELIPYDGWE